MVLKVVSEHIKRTVYPCSSLCLLFLSVWNISCFNLTDYRGVVFTVVLLAYDFRLLFMRGPYLHEKMSLDGNGITCVAFSCNKGLQD